MGTSSRFDDLRAEVHQALTELAARLSTTREEAVLQEALKELHVLKARLGELQAAADDIEDIFS